MPATGEEIRPRRIDSNGIRRRYYVHDALDETEVFDWMHGETDGEPNVPPTLAGLPIADYSADEKEEIHNDYELEVNYGLPQFFSPQEPDTIEYAFSFQAPSALIKQSLETIAAYAPEDAPFGPANYEGAINVVNDGGKHRVEGFNFSPPPESYKLAYRAGSGVITGAYQKLVRSMQGKVNIIEFRGEPAGSLMLVRTSGGRDTSGLWYIEFGFAQIDNDTNIMVGEIEVEQKDGMDLLWAYYGATPDAQANVITQTPKSVYVERIFKRVNFNALNLPP